MTKMEELMLWKAKANDTINNLTKEILDATGGLTGNFYIRLELNVYTIQVIDSAKVDLYYGEVGLKVPKDEVVKIWTLIKDHKEEALAQIRDIADRSFAIKIDAYKALCGED